MNTVDLDSLAAQAKAGDKAAFEAIFDELSDKIYRFMAIRLNNDEAAQDLASQVFLDAWISLKRYDTSKSFKTWIFTIARYTLIDHYRAYKPQVDLEHVTYLSDKTDLEADLDVKLSTEEVLTHMNALPEIYQTVLTLKYIEEMEYREMATILKKTENNLRVLVKRALDKLKLEMNKE